MTKYSPIESEFADSEEEAAYDAWFRAKVQHSIDNPGRLVPHDEVMAKVRAIIAKREADARPLG
jgi:predicted transcriptional regulator